MRITYLFLRTRLTGRAIACLTASAVLAWGWARLLRQDEGIIFLLSTFVPLAAAVVIGVSSRSPFGDVEDTASRSLPTMRLCHMATLLAWGALSVLAAAASWQSPDVELALLRNLAGFTGLVLLAARVIGSSLSWVLPLAYGGLTLVLAGGITIPHWAWSVQPGSHRLSWTVAAGLLLIGVATVSALGTRESRDEAA